MINPSTLYKKADEVVSFIGERFQDVQAILQRFDREWVRQVSTGEQAIAQRVLNYR